MWALADQLLLDRRPTGKRSSPLSVKSGAYISAGIRIYFRRSSDSSKGNSFKVWCDKELSFTKRPDRQTHSVKAQW